VFAPYAAANVRDLFAAGASLTDAWAQPFFADIRAWQREYGFRESDQPRGRCGNWLAPCPMRDHHGAFRELIEKHRPRPTDTDAEAALADPEYRRGMEEFGSRLAGLTAPVWKERYEDGAVDRAQRLTGCGVGRHVRRGPETAF
jgi:hypothetical protein